MAFKRMQLSEQFRQAVRASGLSQSAIARALDINRSAVCRFMAGDRGLTLATLDRLAELLKLKLTEDRKGR